MRRWSRICCKGRKNRIVITEEIVVQDGPVKSERESRKKEISTRERVCLGIKASWRYYTENCKICGQEDKQATVSSSGTPERMRTVVDT